MEYFKSPHKSGFNKYKNAFKNLVILNLKLVCKLENFVKNIIKILFQ